MRKRDPAEGRGPPAAAVRPAWRASGGPSDASWPRLAGKRPRYCTAPGSRHARIVQFSSSTHPLPGAASPQNGRLAWRAPVLRLLAAGVILAVITACASEGSRKKRLLERIQPPQPMLMDSATYGGGVLTVESWLGPSVRLKKTGDLAETAEGKPRPARRRPEASPGESAYPERSDDPFEQGGSSFSAQEIDEMYGHTNYDYILPPRLALTFVFVNNGAKPLTFTIADVNSFLGNFASRPPTFTLAPGQRSSPDPMLSNLDTNFDGLDVTLAVQVGAKVETKVLKLHRTTGSRPAAPHPNAD